MPPRGRTGSSGFTAIAGAVQAIAGPVLGRRGASYGRIVADWPTIVGPSLAAGTLPEKVAAAPGGQAGGILHVRVDSGARAVEMQHCEPLIIERINTYLGYRAVTRLRLIHAPIPKTPSVAAPPPPPPLDATTATKLAATLAAVDDAGLRSVLADLGKYLLAPPARSGNRR